ncbi:hydrogenase formation protein HypD [candidate division WOR-3 bacterium]|uniref:Hydrogenase formation protein HypD n=1 Tax=candidate division WOR-3 bacterium TaxID=2052148 RepID=A0A660SFC0_UNCW3|nr:MAG: hydrogenase formation protein HypD [candidate division WOR-3 bacterium]
MSSTIIDRFRDPRLAQRILDRIKGYGVEIKLMEVCGTHTMAIGRFGLRKLLPPEIDLLSGPGCPVCVTPTSVIDSVLSLKGVRVATFGDLLRVPGRGGTLEMARGRGLDVRVVYSPFDALKMAREKETVFIGVGFETTAPGVAATIITAREEGIKNFSVLSAFKLIPPAIDALLASGKSRIEGFILPGHVSTIIGSRPYQFLPERYRIGGVIAGFEPVDILEAIRDLIDQKMSNRPRIKIGYRRSVRPEGNERAKELMNRVFTVEDSLWRGLGWIKRSGLTLRDEYAQFDASRRYQLLPPSIDDDPNCRCGDVLRGLIKPPSCPLFGRSCTPDHPIGPCMVSSEGSCAAYYHYE